MKSKLLGWFEKHLNSVLIISALLIVCFPFLFSLPAFCRFFAVNEGHNVGDAIGGITAPIIGLVSILLLCVTLKAQKDAEYRSSLENRIFQMISLHRRNVEEMHSDAKNKDGQDVFKMIMNQIEESLEEIAPFFEGLSVDNCYQDGFLMCLQEAVEEVDPIAFAKLDIAYSTVYLGTRKEYIETLEDVLSKRYKRDFVKLIVHYLQLKPVKNYKEGFKQWVEFNSWETNSKTALVSSIVNNKPSMGLVHINLLTKGTHTLFYWGHEFRLAHYFRHLFSTVEYIDSQEELTFKEKSDYVKLLRTQISNTEQILFFANSITEMGAFWELFNKQKNRGDGYISKYELIKNIPQKEVFGISYQKVYPNVDYEFKS